MLNKELSNKSKFTIVVASCIIGFLFLIAYLMNMKGYENKSEIGKVELFVKSITSPQGLAFDKKGRLFVQSDWDGKISIISKDGTAMDYSYIEKYYGYGMDIDYFDNFIIASKHQVTVFDNSGKVLRVIEGFDQVYDVVMGPGNVIYVSDSATNMIYSISTNNEISIFAEFGNRKTDNKPNAAGICFDKDYKNLYVVNMYSGDLYKIKLTREFKLDKIEIMASNLQNPNFIDVDEKGNVYITCLGDNTIVRVNQNSIKEFIDTKGKLSSPSGIAINNDNGNVLYVGSKDNNSIYKISVGTNK